MNDETIIQVYPAKEPGPALAIIMPAYNEEESLPDVLREWHAVALQHAGHLLVLDDGSTDGTLEMLKESQPNYSQLVIIQKRNSGHGATCLAGYRYATGEGYEWIFQTDSDGQTSAEDFETFWARRAEADFLFGYRPRRGDGLGRMVISKVLRLATRLTTGVYVKDPNVPFRLMRAEKLRPFLERIPEDLFLVNAFLAALIQKERPICWLSISFAPRTGGVPSVSWKRFFSLGLKVTGEFWRYRKSVRQLSSEQED